MNWNKETILIKKSKRYSRIPKIEMSKKFSYHIKSIITLN